MHKRTFLTVAAGAGFSCVSPLTARATSRSVSTALPANVWDASEFVFNDGNRALPGVAIRLPALAGSPPALFVACRICPHQGCVFGYERDYDLVGEIIGKDLTNPVLFCRCHMSTYDPARGGQVINGPAPRPPWTFDYKLREATVEVTGVEDGVGTPE